MKKEVIIVLALLFVFSAGVLAQTTSNPISKGVGDFVDDFVEGTGIADEEVDAVSQVNQSDLPEEVDLKNIGENKVGIYEVNYTENNEQKQIFVVTYAASQLPKKEVSSTKNIQSLHFGYNGFSDSASYLETSIGVSLSEDKGYVMLRPGSVTGISTSLDVNGQGIIEIKVYKNGQDTGFSNIISSDGTGKIDYDLQSEGITDYAPGDLISVYIESSDVSWGNAITMVETTS